MKWILLRWLMVVVMLFGLLLAGGDGPLFPLSNVAGLSLVAAAWALISRDPAYDKTRKEGWW